MCHISLYACTHARTCIPICTHVPAYLRTYLMTYLPTYRPTYQPRYNGMRLHAPVRITPTPQETPTCTDTYMPARATGVQSHTPLPYCTSPYGSRYIPVSQYAHSHLPSVPLYSHILFVPSTMHPPPLCPSLSPPRRQSYSRYQYLADAGEITKDENQEKACRRQPRTRRIREAPIGGLVGLHMRVLRNG